MKKIPLLLIATISAIFVQAQWWPDVRITYDPYNSYTSMRRSVSSSNDTVHVVWCDESMEHPTVHYCKSIDAGLNWDTELQLTSGEYYDEQPSIAASRNYIHLVWIYYVSFESNDNEIIYMRSTDGGENWESAVQLTSYGGIKWYPAIAVSGNYVHVIWYDICKVQGENQWEIYYLRSADYGATWDETVRLTFDPERSVYCTLAADGPTLHLVWHDWRHGDPEVYYKRSDDNGTTWGEDIRMTNCDGESRFPEIAASGSFVQIVFQDNRDGDFEIYSFTSLDGGLTWGPETRLTYESSSSEHPFIAITGSESHVVWQDLRAGWYQVYYKLGHDCGTTWDDDERLVNMLYNTKYPSLSFSGEWLHIVWQDERDGNYEIYCKNKYIESAPAGQFSITPDTLNLDTVYLGGYNVDSLNVCNYGLNSLWIDSIFTNSPFSISLDINDWMNSIKNIIVPSGDPFGKKTIYTRFNGIQPGWYMDSISLAIEDSLYHITIEGTCKESPGFIGEAECFPTSVYPNPASRQLTVVQLDSWTVGQLAVRISIVDLYGRDIKEFGNISSFPYQIDISDLRDGMYLLRIINEEAKSGSTKFLKIEE